MTANNVPGPLSFAQRRLWFLDRLAGDRLEYLDPIALRLRGPLNVPALRAALDAIVARHAALRTRYVIVGAEPHQVVDDVGSVAIELHDVEREQAAVQLIEHSLSRPFDLASEPPVRITLVRLAEDEHVLLILLHHIASDAWSRSLLARELRALYTSVSADTPVRRPAPAMSYVDFARWQREQPSGAAAGNLMAFWREQLAGLEPVDLPTDRPRGAVRDARGSTVDFRIPPELHRRVAELGRRNRATPFMTFLAGYVALLHRYSGQPDIVVGTPAAGRNRVEVEDVIGCFVNLLVTRTDLTGDPSTVELLGRVREATLKVLAHQDIPFERLVDQLAPERDLSVNPLFQLAFVWQNTPPVEFTLPGIVVTPFPVSRASAKFDLTLRLTRAADGGLAGEAEYADALFDRGTVERFTAHYVQLLKQAVARPETPLSRLDLVTPGDRVVLDGAAATGPPASSGEPMHRLFEQRVAQSPDAIALYHNGIELTYAEVNRRANRLARMLRAAGVGTEATVGFMLEPGAELVVGLLAALKAGGAYLPIDPSTPLARANAILADARPAVLVTEQARPGLDHPATVVLEREHAVINQFADDNLLDGTGSEDLAYAIYTSGSTGPPKGVLVTHRNVTQLFAATQPDLGFGPEDVWTLFHSAAFDFSVWEIWGALLHGGRLVIVPPRTARSPAALLDLLAAQRVTVLSQTPSAFRGLVRAATGADAAFSDLRLVVLGGEPVDLEAVAPWFDRYGEQIPVLNAYGITETTVHTTFRRLSLADLGLRYSPIGRSLPGVRIQLLDRAMNRAPVGVPAEIYVGGPGLARGYLNRPGLTAARFVADPFAEQPGERLYRSGDLARLLPNGELEYLGRIDNQVKIRGFRIELGEIEAVLGSHPAVALAAMAVSGAADDRRLVAYVEWRAGRAVAPTELRAYLSERLPGYMVPASYVTLPALPRTVGGKLDRKALPAPEHTRGQAGTRQAYIAPRSLTEHSVARIWAAEVGLDRVGVEDNFFDVGGDSIRAVRLVGALRRQGWPVTVEMIFQHRTVAGVVRALYGAGDSIADTSVQPFELIAPEDRARLPAGVVDAYPLSLTQFGMLFEMDAARDTRPYHNVVSYPIRDPGGFSAGALRLACDALAEQHEVLRTSFDLVSFVEPLQLVHRRVTVPVSIVDLREVPSAAREVEQTRHRAALAVFEPRRAPLLRVHADVLSDERWILTLTENHAILDGWSHHSLATELLRRYREHRDGTPVDRAPAGVRFADFIALERAALRDAGSISFWSDRITVFERLKLRVTGGEPPGSVRAECVELADVEPQLRAIAHAEGLPRKTLLLTAHLAALAAFTGQRRFLTGLVCNGRPEVRGGDEVCGMFLNTVPFGMEIAGGWRELLRAVYAEELAIWSHRRFPLPAMQQRWGGRERLLDVLFSYLDFHVLDREMVEAEGIVKLVPLEFPLRVSTEPGALVLIGRTDRIAPKDVETLADLHRRALWNLAGEDDMDRLFAEGSRR